jgi:hypothetical protein
MLLAMFAGWINRHPQDIIEYLKTENTILRSGIDKKRMILTDNLLAFLLLITLKQSNERQP